MSREPRSSRVASRALVWLLPAALFAGCSNPATAPEARSREVKAQRGAEASAEETSSKKLAAAKPAKPKLVDPRRGGFVIGLGEWAVTPEAEAIRPGKVTFVIENQGTMEHGFEIELEGESSGHGSGDLFKSESTLLQPGGSTRMTVTLTRPGLYKIECLVDGHDDMGMEGTLDVRADAPLVKVEGEERPGAVDIEGFAFSPPEITIDAGTKVTWRNADPAEHTVTGEDFGSDVLSAGDVFEHRFDERGTFAYRCAIHPEMKGEVKVE